MIQRTSRPSKQEEQRSRGLFQSRDLPWSGPARCPTAGLAISRGPRPELKRRISPAVMLLLALLPAPLQAEAAPATEAATEAPPLPVVTEIVASAAARLRSFPGVIEPAVTTTLAFQTAGTMETRPVNLGDAVAAGQTLATLDQITLSEDVRAAEAAVAAAQAQADYARQSFARVDELNRRGVASNAQIEQATASRDSTSAALRAAEADLARARDAETFGTLKAPAAGLITSVEAEPGAVVAAGTPIVVLAADGPRDAVIDVPSEVLALLTPGARFTIEGRAHKADGGRGQQVGGRLRLIEPVADDGARTHRLRIALDDMQAGEAAPGTLPIRLGSLVTVRMDLPATPVLSLPRSAILSPEATADSTTSPAVWRIGSGRKLERVAVTLGPELGDRMVVTAGLSQGDEVLLRGIRSVHEGQQVGDRIEAERIGK